jgi:hypothetical protein
MFTPALIITFLLTQIWLATQSPVAWAGCGCDKPPPVPAIVTPHAAFPGMPITFTDSNLQVGQTWTVEFQQDEITIASTSATVALKRDLTNPSGTTFTPQLRVVVPEIPVGPTRLYLSSTSGTLVVPHTVFTVIAKPILVSEQTTEYEVSNYTTAAGVDGTVYMSVGGLREVCQAMSFETVLGDYALRVEHVTIINSQGFFIDTLSAPNAAHFAITPQQGATSDVLHYFRHSFENYCASHRPGGAKEVDPANPDWHLDGTPHVDYSTLIFAMTGKMPNGAKPTPGPISSELDVEALLGDGTGAWEVEQPEETILGDDDDDDDDDDD